LGDWDDEAKRYKIVLQDVTTGERTHTEADIMFIAIGGFMNPLYPKDMSGVEKFQGLSWHSAQWRHDVDLSGKRVGVIGNGCSA
jgi:cation diffusion facilitator CzcD-associated flavoprotein CzcO